MKAILIFLMLLIPAWCYADGNELLKACGLAVSYMDDVTKPNLVKTSPEIMFCLGFMQGITNMNFVYQEVLKSDAQFCLPERGITNAQAARIIVKYLRNYPTHLHEDEFVLALVAFKDAFPCKRGR